MTPISMAARQELRFGPIASLQRMLLWELFVQRLLLGIPLQIHMGSNQ